MQNSFDLSKSAKIQLKNWLRVKGKLTVYLTTPEELDSMTESARKEVERKERTDTAHKLVDLHLHETKEFTDILSMLVNPKNKAAVEDCRREIREALGEIQVSHWSTYVGSKRNSKKLAVA
jgi:hypothetical protein